MSNQTSKLIHLPASLESVKIKSLPDSAYYVADFLSEAEEEAILKKVSSIVSYAGGDTG
jgi:alkylated DNA repair protein alkB family protein 6